MEFFFAFIVFVLLVFAVVGFVATLIWFTSDKAPRQPKIPQPTLTGDVLAARRLIDHLRNKKQINEKAYQQLRGFLDREFSEQFEAPTRPGGVTPNRQVTAAKDPTPTEPQSLETPPSRPSEPVPKKAETPDLSRSVATPIRADDSVVLAEAVTVGRVVGQAG